jgi:hypothetical protein
VLFNQIQISRQGGGFSFDQAQEAKGEEEKKEE